MLKKSLIPKHQLGGPIARLAQQKSSGSWGNRGEGNEGQSAFENGLETAVKFIGDISGLTDVYNSIFNKEEEIVTPEIIDGKPIYPLREQPIIGAPKLIPGLKGVPTEALKSFFPKWQKGYDSFAATKSRLKTLGRLDELVNSKPYITFQKLDQQLRKMVMEANRNFNTVLLKGRRNASKGQTSLSKTITSNGMKAASDKAANLTKRQKMQHKVQTAATTGDMRVHNMGAGSKQQRAQWDEVNKTIQNTSSKLWAKIVKSQDNLSKATDPKQAEQIQAHINSLYKEFFDRYPGYDTRFNYIYNKVTK